MTSQYTVSALPACTRYGAGEGSRKDKGKLRTAGLLAVISLGLPVCAQIPEQYPKPLIHTSADHPADRVLIITVDGLRAVKLANFVSSHPESALAELSKRGVTYTNAHVQWPDTAAGMMAIVSGGSPISTGIFSSEGYDRSLQRDGDRCERTESALDLAAGQAELLKTEKVAKGCKPINWCG